MKILRCNLTYSYFKTAPPAKQAHADHRSSSTRRFKLDKITIQHYTDSVEIIIKGDLNIHNTDKLLNEFKALMTDGTEYKIFGINCANLDSIDSSGLGALISMAKRAEEINAEFYVCDINKKVLTLFDISHLNKYFQIIPLTEFRKIVQP